ncbi:MAG: cyclic nucleotide-binding domain-containing protein [Actinobacteria bacterium]|nr:cyclic nucleotide-binding domain-containing protein [Actinomycetota bacterium]
MTIEPRAVRAFKDFAQLDDGAIDELRANLRPIVVPRGSTLFRQGDHDASIYLLVEGIVDVYVTLPEAGKRADSGPTVATLEAKTVLGELGLLLGVPRTATIVARTDTVCWQITQESFSAAVERGEVWTTRLALAIASVLARRFVVARAEVTRYVGQLEPGSPEPARKVAELAQLRTRLLAEWSF